MKRARPDVSPRYRIVRLKVDAGFLGGLDLELDPHLNCVIGGRGTGKTTVLQLLRWALKDPQDPHHPDRAGLLSLVRSNLESGNVRVEVETRTGLRYAVERGGAEKSPAEVLDERDQPTGFSLARGAVFDLDVYSQNEIESVASSPAAQLALLDRFRQTELRDLEDRVEAARRDLRSNAHELVTLADQREDLDKGLEELGPLQERLKAQKKADKAETGEDLSRELHLKGLREREAETLQQLQRHVQANREAFVELGRRVGEAPAFPSEAGRGPNAALVEAAGEAAREYLEAVRGLIADLQRCAERFTARTLPPLVEGLRKAHVQQEAAYRDVLQAQEQDKGRAAERLALQRRVADLEEQARRHKERGQALAAKQRQRRELLKELTDLRGQRFKLRRAVAESLTKRLGPEIVVSVDFASDTAAYAELLAEAFRRAPRASKHVQLAATIAGKVPPATLAKLVQAGEAQELAALTKLTLERAAWVVEQLRDTAELYEAEVVELADRPSIALIVGGAPKQAAELSGGQKCTTILPILLLESDKPLLIDQPEDNLDNQFIFDVVVTRLRDIKATRQLIFVTHNPNIPVLGDAERVIVLGSDGRRAEVIAAGGVMESEVRKHVETILEGGRDAFLRRIEAYGLAVKDATRG